MIKGEQFFCSSVDHILLLFFTFSRKIKSLHIEQGPLSRRVWLSIRCHFSEEEKYSKNLYWYLNYCSLERDQSVDSTKDKKMIISSKLKMQNYPSPGIQDIVQILNPLHRNVPSITTLTFNQWSSLINPL